MTTKNVPLLTALLAGALAPFGGGRRGEGEGPAGHARQRAVGRGHKDSAQARRNARRDKRRHRNRGK